MSAPQVLLGVLLAGVERFWQPAEAAERAVLRQAEEGQQVVPRRAAAVQGGPLLAAAVRVSQPALRAARPSAQALRRASSDQQGLAPVRAAGGQPAGPPLQVEPGSARARPHWPKVWLSIAFVSSLCLLGRAFRKSVSLRTHDEFVLQTHALWHANQR